MGRLSVTEAKEREDYILELIKVSGRNGVSLATIGDDCGMKPGSRAAYMRSFVKKHDQVRQRNNASNVPVYFWVEPPAEEKREVHSAFVRNREKKYKNHEGYTDMTAGKAIENVEKATEDLLDPQPGEIWETIESNGAHQYLYILAVSDGAVPCIRLYEAGGMYSPETIKRPLKINLGGLDYVGDFSRPSSKSIKYLLRKTKECDDALLCAARKVVADIFEIKSFRIEKVEVPGPERIVYKEKEPVEIPDGYISEKEAEYARVCEQLTIWKDIAMKLLAKNS